MALKIEELNVHDKKGDYVNVKHLRLFGKNREIGYKLGELAKNRHRIKKPKHTSTLYRNCQHNYLIKNYPVHYERMLGYSNAYGDVLNQSEYDYTSFGVTLNTPACSAVYYPPQYTETGTGIISRNADLPLSSFSEIISGKNQDNEDSVMSKPYIMELYPDKGYSSIIMFFFELYGSGLDGVNSEGLSVVHLHADNPNAKAYKPSMESSVGINEMLVVQLLLDNCKTVDEAKEMLLSNKHYRMILPTHLLIADRYGKSFVWEYPPEHNKDYFIDGNSETQIITNFPLHQYPSIDTFPESKDLSCPFARYKTLDNALRNTKGRISTDRIKEINFLVFIGDEMFESIPEKKERTIYHNLYETHKKSMEISFYRKDENNKQLRTEYFKFQLK
ncbi:MAG: linear amide C-N hydrolase [bacterium]|nr:linear amide C-N hydrolase [bacterium]